MSQWQQAVTTARHICLLVGYLAEPPVMKTINPTRIWLAVEPVDMRIGIDGLSSLVQQTLGKSPCDGSAYVFRNRRCSRLKLVVWDSTGVWLCQRRLHKGSFVWPHGEEAVYDLSEEQWNWLVAGVDWQRLTPKPPQNWVF